MGTTNEQAAVQRLSQITTAWTVLFAAHQGSPDTVTLAQQQLLQRYTPPAYRYLLGAVHDPDVAAELFQEFALRVVRGAFKQADPERGRFRNLVKTTLCNLVVDHQRKQKRKLAALSEAIEPAAADGGELAAQEQQFTAAWRSELMSRTWDALAACDRQTGQHLYTVLKFRVDHPDVRSPAMAERLSAALGKPLTAEWIRKRLFLAREKFGDLLLDQISRSQEKASAETLEAELLDLGLFDYCRSAWQRRKELS